MPERADLERRTTELLQRLIRFNTVNPPGNEEEAQNFLKGLLEDAGFECELLASVEGRPNLVARLPGGSDGPVLCLLGHVDTVLADPDDWSVDPWSGELKDGCVWGRGALDMKSQVAAEIAAALELVEQGWRPEAGELKIVVTADEEVGAVHGAQWLCREHPDAVRCDLVVNEGAGHLITLGGKRRYGVCVSEKGVFRFKLAAHGSAGHASLPRIGDNALLKLAPVLEALREGRPAYEHTPEGVSFLKAFDIQTDDLAEAVRLVEEEDPRVAVMLEPMLGVTFTPTMVSASEKINVIPARAELQVDCRVPAEQGEDHARARIDQVIGSDGYTVTFAEGAVSGNRSPVETPLMDFIRGFVGREDPGSDVAPCALPGFSDSRWFRAAFPDCVAYGFFPQRTMDVFEAVPLIHGADERIPVEDLGLAAAFYSELAQEVLR